MPAKGEIYSRIDVACDKWAIDWIEKNGLRKADLARALGQYNRFVTDLVRGNINTLKTLEIIVEKAEGGNYLKMAKYALTDAGLEVLKDLNFKRNLTPLQRDEFKRIRELTVKLMDRNGTITPLIDELEKKLLQGMNRKD